jgi:hypothetical protein
MNFCNEAHTLSLARLLNANTLIRNLPNKTEHVVKKTQGKYMSQFALRSAFLCILLKDFFFVFL